MNMLGRTVNNSLYTLYIGLPRSVGTAVGMGNPYTESNALSANIAFCHGAHLLKFVH